MLWQPGQNRHGQFAPRPAGKQEQPPRRCTQTGRCPPTRWPNTVAHGYRRLSSRMTRTCPLVRRCATPARSRATTRKTARTPRSSAQGAEPDCASTGARALLAGKSAADRACSQVARLLPEPEASRKRPARKPGTPSRGVFLMIYGLSQRLCAADDDKKPFKWWKVVPDSERPFWCMACFKSFNTEDEIFEHGTPDSPLFRDCTVCKAGWCSTGQESGCAKAKRPRDAEYKPAEIVYVNAEQVMHRSLTPRPHSANAVLDVEVFIVAHAATVDVQDIALYAVRQIRSVPEQQMQAVPPPRRRRALRRAAWHRSARSSSPWARGRPSAFRFAPTAFAPLSYAEPPVPLTLGCVADSHTVRANSGSRRTRATIPHASSQRSRCEIATEALRFAILEPLRLLAFRAAMPPSPLLPAPPLPSPRLCTSGASIKMPFGSCSPTSRCRT